MPQRGKLIIIGMLSLALIAATSAWWYQYRQGRRILEFWGAADALRIRLAPDCQLLWLKRPADTGDSLLEIQGEVWAIHSDCAIDDRRGFVHARQALIQDASFLWEEALRPTGPWQCALRFTDDRGETLLAFDLDHGVVVHVHAEGRHANIRPITAGLRRFFHEQCPPTTSSFSHPGNRGTRQQPT